MNIEVLARFSYSAIVGLVSGIMSCKRSSSNFLLLYDDDEGDVVDNGELTQVESHEEVGHSEVANQKPEHSQLN